MRVWGAVTPSVFASGTPWDRCELDAAQLWLRAGLRRSTHLTRADVTQVVVGHRRFPPFLWRTTVEFVVHGTRIDRMFIPWRRRKFRRALEAAGWPVRDA